MLSPIPAITLGKRGLACCGQLLKKKKRGILMQYLSSEFKSRKGNPVVL